MVAQRFGAHCQRMVTLAKAAETSASDYPQKLPGSPYVGFGNVPGEERLLRETESDFPAMLASAVTLDDLICNCTRELARKSVAWQRYDRDADGESRTRSDIRKLLREAYKASGNDVKPLEWVSRNRNKALHEMYFYAAAVKNEGLVVFTTSPIAYAKMDYRRIDALTSIRVLEAIAETRKYLAWFYAETERQASGV